MEERDGASCYSLNKCLHNDDQRQQINMVACDTCETWYHPHCDGYWDAECFHFDVFNCSACLEKYPKLEVSYKDVKNLCFRDPFDYHPEYLKKFTERDAEGHLLDHSGDRIMESGSEMFVQRLRKYIIDNESIFPKAEKIFHVGERKINLQYFEKYGWHEPIYFPPHLLPDGLEAPENIDIKNIHHQIGYGFDMKYTDTQTLEEYPCSLEDWVDNYFTKSMNSKRYLKNPKINKRFNVISLEYSKSNLSNIVKPPKLVQDISWVNLWPERDRLGRTTYDTPNEKPSFMNYCLMGTKDSYTEWHIDLGGTSVWYHIHKGKKIFILVRPTVANLALYQKWETWVTDDFQKQRTSYIEFCQLHGHDPEPSILTLTPKSTVLLPSGWIHCVLTPEDSIVFGGNCLHSFNIETQLKMRDLESQCQIDEKYRLHGFTKLHWYVADHLRKRLKVANLTKNQDYPEVYHSALRKIYKFLKKSLKKELCCVPDEIAPEDCLRKIRESLCVRDRFKRQGLFYEDDGRFKAPKIEKSEIGTETDCIYPEAKLPPKDRPEKEIKKLRLVRSSKNDEEYEPPMYRIVNEEILSDGHGTVYNDLLSHARLGESESDPDSPPSKKRSVGLSHKKKWKQSLKETRHANNFQS